MTPLRWDADPISLYGAKTHELHCLVGGRDCNHHRHLVVSRLALSGVPLGSVIPPAGGILSLGLAIRWSLVSSVEMLASVAEIALVEPAAAFRAFHEVLPVVRRHPVDALA